MAYLQENGLNAYYYVQGLHEFIGMEDFKPVRGKSRRELPGGPGIRGMLDAIEAILPSKQLEDLFDKMLQTSPAFANMVTQLRSDEFKEIVTEMRANEDYQKVVDVAKQHGVDIEFIHEILHRIFGW